MEVPQFRDGECEVRRLWDEAVAEAMGWDAEELACQRELLQHASHTFAGSATTSTRMKWKNSALVESPSPRPPAGAW